MSEPATSKLVHKYQLASLQSRPTAFTGKKALEIGGPSDIFKDGGILPVYAILTSVDNCLYSTQTIWTGNVAQTFNYHPLKPAGIQYICEATDLKSVSSSSYDCVLASHCLEHVANPLRALAEWKRVLKKDGVFLLVLPHKEGTFDWRRPVTPLAHMIDDFEKQTGEDDLTHLPEILSLHDLEKDPLAGSPEQFRERSLQNSVNRALHHHVFDTLTAIQLADRAGFQLLQINNIKPFHIVIVARNSQDAPDNARFLKATPSYAFTSATDSLQTRRSTFANFLLPYRLLPFSIKHPIRQAISGATHPNRTYARCVDAVDKKFFEPKRARMEAAHFSYQPKLSVIMPVYNTHIHLLNAAIRSVRAQYYPNWELCICDDASTDKRVPAALRKWETRDPRIKVIYSTVNEHISGASNRALALATGEFVGLLDHDDVITPDALFENLKFLQEHPDADMIYSDEDKLDAKGRLKSPYQKPDWSPELMLRLMYTGHFGVYRRQLINEIGGFRKGFEGSQDHDLVLRLSEKTNRVYHIPKVLYHWRMVPGSAAGSTEAKPYAYPAAKRAIAEHLERQGIRAAVLDGESNGRYRVVYNSQESEAVADAPPVSIIVPNYNHARFLKQRIDSILNQTFQDFELILLDDASTDDSRSILSSYASDPRVRIEFNETNSGSPFKQWNKGVRLARGKYVWIAESDDYADTRLLERLVQALDADPNIAFSWCRSWWITPEGDADDYADRLFRRIDRSVWQGDFRMDGRELCRSYLAATNVVPNASAVLFRRRTYELVGGPDESLRVCGDWKLWAAMALTGEVAYVAEPLNCFRFHDSTARIRAVKSNIHVLEPLGVIRWILRQSTATEAAINSMRSETSKVWVPAFLSMRTPLRMKREIWRVVRDIDPHPFRSAFAPAMNTFRLKILRHWRELTRPVRTRAREFWAWWTSKTPHFPSVAQVTQSIAALSALEAHAPAETDSESPIFILSTGMRTGSTLLQRILITDSRLLLWGEPMGEINITARISQMLSDFLSPSFLDWCRRQPSLDSPTLATSWTAILQPSPENFRLGLRSFFETWLGQPARQNGFARWGFKKVRLDASAAVVLRWLYPSAKFILLARHPFDCYRSFADAGSNPHFVQHPSYVINSAASFAREWNRIAVSWSQLPADFPSMLIKYEDLVSGTFDFRGLESWLGLKLNETEALSEKVGRTAFRARLHPYERWIVSREAAPGMRILGYSSRPVAVAKPIPIQSAECAITDQKSA